MVRYNKLISWYEKKKNESVQILFSKFYSTAKMNEGIRHLLNVYFFLISCIQGIYINDIL